MSVTEFNFEAEFALLDVGATSSMLRSGGVRPTVMLFDANASVEAVALDWTPPEDVAASCEEARRYARDSHPAAYAFIAHLSRNGSDVELHLPPCTPQPGTEYLGVAMYAEGGGGRALLYPIRRTSGRISFGVPEVLDNGFADWVPLGDIWSNPFCKGDVVRFQLKDRPVDPASPLWRSVVELTRLRIHEDQPNSTEYMAFLDDLRNGIFSVVERDAQNPEFVSLKTRTTFNPLGFLLVAASRLALVDAPAPRLEKQTV